MQPAPPLGGGAQYQPAAPQQPKTTARQADCGGAAGEKTGRGKGPDGPPATSGRYPPDPPQEAHKAEARQTTTEPRPKRGGARRGGGGPSRAQGANQPGLQSSRADRDRGGPRSAAAPGPCGPVRDPAALPCRRRGRPERERTSQYACPRRPFGPTVTPPPQRQAASRRQWTAFGRPVGPARADNVTSRGSQRPHARHGRAGAVRRTGLRPLAPAAAPSLAGSDVPANGSVWSVAEFATTVQASPTPRRIGGARGGRLPQPRALPQQVCGPGRGRGDMPKARAAPRAQSERSERFPLLDTRTLLRHSP